MKFSELNTENIYYSGNFFLNNDYNLNGLCIYNIQSNTIDTSLTYYYTKSFDGYFVLFDNEERIMNTSGIYLSVVNTMNKSEEYSKFLDDTSIPFGYKIIYSNQKKYFIGEIGDYLGMVQYDSQTGIKDNEPIIQTLFPNPTNNSVTIKYDCKDSQVEYKIIDANGKILNDSIIQNLDSSLLLDFTQYLAGSYIVQLTCDQQVITYKVIKE
jgi:hypothetical protein